ncbi:hypothetical protein PAECIP111893_01587 [Paenibacillus plantiphilus]|uniref:Uncharacterized protein n=1 Tax=Paenibacillus plantiphilus TaxID=2905650 RepID=A0ABN8G9E2_9BACL|nr:hypothetical protein [Paenibacillus plantiphilus]CAH1201360.1 hypothetical protein PAECIP111893_01587 [Paenibacillus plantiphilus]
MTRKLSTAMESVNLAAKLADLKEDHYRILLTVSAVTELLIDKGLFTRDELELKAAALDLELDSLISSSLHPMA